MDVLEQLQTLLPYTEVATLSFYIGKAQQVFCNLTNLSTVPPEANYIIIDMVQIYVNRYGNEGISNYSTSGVKYTFETGLPADIYSQIANFTVLMW